MKTTNLYAIATQAAVKFGVARNVGARLKELQTGSAEELYQLGSVPCDARLEGAIHLYLKPDRLRGEWFKFSRRVNEIISLIRDKRIDDLEDLIVCPGSYVKP